MPVPVHVASPEIARASLHVAIPRLYHLYALPVLALYPLLAYAYFIDYDRLLGGEEWTFLATVGLGAGHALSYLVTRWSVEGRTWVTTRKARSISDASVIRIIPHLHRGTGDIVPLSKKDLRDPATWTFSYQRDTYVVDAEASGLAAPLPNSLNDSHKSSSLPKSKSDLNDSPKSSSLDEKAPATKAIPNGTTAGTLVFTKLPYPSSGRPPLSTFANPQGLPSLPSSLPASVAALAHSSVNPPSITTASSGKASPKKSKNKSKATDPEKARALAQIAGASPNSGTSGNNELGNSPDDTPLARELRQLKALYGGNEFNVPIPSFGELFGEHATAPFFVFQIFCVALWCLDEYWYYSLFTLFMLVVFECTVVWQRVKTLTEFRTMSVVPYAIACLRGGVWGEVMTDELVPGDVVGVAARPHTETSVPADILLISGTCIVNEAMLSGESTPLLKESIELLLQQEGGGGGGGDGDGDGDGGGKDKLDGREGGDGGKEGKEGTGGKEKLDVDGKHRNAVVFSGTKIVQSVASVNKSDPTQTTAPDNACLGVVLRTGFGTAQGQLVRTMIFSTERVSANNVESFLFIGFLLIFAVAASWYVWVKGIERELKKSKLLLDCILIITSVVPPELPMELSLAVNGSLVALSKFAIFCTEPFRIPFAGRVDVCCFDKTGTITAENLVLEGIVGVDPADRRKLVNVQATSRETTLCLAAAHALVRLDDGTVVGDPMEKTTLESLGWTLEKGDTIHPSATSPHKTQLTIRRRFQFSSALKRMSTVSSLPGGKAIAAVKGAPETIKEFLTEVPEFYDETYKWFSRNGSRVLALGMKDMEVMSVERINKLGREQVESGLVFAGFLVFHCPLKSDAVETLKMLADSSHRCVMITGDNPLTAVHVARDVEIVDREVLVLDLKEDHKHDSDLVWRTVDESKVIPVDPSEPLDLSLFEQYDICITGVAMKQFEGKESWNDLVQNTWVYARVSPAQKETILTTLKTLGYTTLMAGDGTNDVGALKQAHIGVALLDGTPEDLQKIAEHQKNERIKKVYESQLKISARFGQPPPPVPAAIAHLFPNAVQAQQKAATELQVARKKNPMEKFDLAAITDKLADMEEEDEVPKIKLGDASCAAPFTSKLSHVSAITHIIRQGRCTLVATIQMYKILALNCLITAYSLSVQYLDGIKFGDYQVTITGMLMSVCFLCISRAKPVEKLSRERPLGNIFNLYVLLSVLLQFALHIVTLVYITNLTRVYEERGPIDLEAKFEPSLLNTAIYLLGLSQQVSTFAINFQGRPFREGIRENSALWWGLVSASAVAFSGATDFMPELNRWLQIVEMEGPFKVSLTLSMVVDFVGCWLIEITCKHLFANLEPKPMVTRGRERRVKRRAEQARLEIEAAANGAVEKKVQ